MKKILKIVVPVLIAIVLVVAICLGIFLIKPQMDIKKNRENLKVESVSQLSSKDCIHFLKTGSSDAILIESDGHFALVDCGEDNDNPRNLPDLELQGYEEEVLKYLNENAKNGEGKIHLDFVLGTHAHSDHIGGFDTIISAENVEVDRAYLKRYEESKIRQPEIIEWDNMEVYNQMVDALNAKNIPIIADITETEFKLGNFNITLFNTEYESTNGPVGENDNAIGVLVELNGKKVFLAADIDNNSGDEDRLGPQIGDIDVLKVGHHSYSGSTSVNWLKTLKPEVCVVTNDYETTDKRTLRKISRVAHSPILVTGEENGVVIAFNEDGTLSYYNHK